MTRRDKVITSFTYVFFALIAGVSIFEFFGALATAPSWATAIIILLIVLIYFKIEKLSK